MAKDRAVIFVDGNNWYHSLGEAGVTSLGALDYRLISQKLAGPGRDWISTRYYIGQVTQAQSAALYADQRRFISKLAADDPRISMHFGRLEPRPAKNAAAEELAQYLAGLSTRIDQQVYQDLVALAQRHKTMRVYVEKAVDVMIALDVVLMALRNEYDAAYILSCDGDLTPAVEGARQHGKKVFAASCGTGAKIAAAVNAFIPLEPAWFANCYRPAPPPPPSRPRRGTGRW